MDILVSIEYRDDTKKEFRCNDMPFIGERWITLYFPTYRKMIPNEAIAEINYRVSEHKRKR